MRRRIAVVNDGLSSGGHVLDYGQDGSFRFGGHKVALIGGLAHCDACQSDGTIAKAGGPKRLGFGGAGEVALDQDIVNCKCPVPPTISASLAGESYCDDEVERLGTVSGAGYGIAAAAVSSVSAVGTAAYANDQPGQQEIERSDVATPLGNAQPFEYGRDQASTDSQTFAARGVSEGQEAECYEQYERDMDECQAYRAAMGGARFMDACTQRAFMNYQQCRGY